MTHVAWHIWTWRNAPSEAEAAQLLSNDPAFAAIENQITQRRAQLETENQRLNRVRWSQIGVDQVEARTAATRISSLSNQIQVLEGQRDQILKARFDTDQLTNPNLVANNFWTSWLTIDPVTWLQVSNDAILNPNQTGNIAADLSRRTSDIINFQQWAWEEQLQAIQEARNLASWIWQTQLNRTWQVFNQASRGALAAWAVSEGIIWGIASRSWASWAQRLASINASQAWTAERLWQLNAQRLEQENAILLNYLNWINTAIQNENAIRWNVSENVSNQLGTLRQNIWDLSVNELGFQRGLPDVLNSRAQNQLALQAQQLANADSQLRLNQLAAELWVAVPSIAWLWASVAGTPAATTTPSVWWGWTTSSSAVWWGWSFWWAAPIAWTIDSQNRIVVDSDNNNVDDNPDNNISRTPLPDISWIKWASIDWLASWWFTPAQGIQSSWWFVWPPAPNTTISAPRTFQEIASQQSQSNQVASNVAWSNFAARRQQARIDAESRPFWLFNPRGFIQ